MPAEQILGFFAKYIESELGIVYAEHNYFQLQNRLEEIAKHLEIGNIETLYGMAQAGIYGQLKQILLDHSTNNETSFFRDPNVFKALAELAIPDLVQARVSGGHVNIWSAASSTGQEALSLAMLFEEWATEKKTPLPFKILGTDISDRALARAQSAEYTQFEVQRGLPIQMLVRHFSKDERDMWHAKSSLTKHIEFKSLNLRSGFRFPQPFDLVFCRNVLIYQSVENKKDILGRIAASIRPGGFLVMGSGESVMGLSDEFDRAPIDSSVIYRKKAA